MGDTISCMRAAGNPQYKLLLIYKALLPGVKERRRNGVNTMELNVPAPPHAAAVPSEVGKRPSGKGISELPPKEWSERMHRKYGILPISENARKVLERRYLKKDTRGEILESPEEMVARVAHNIASAEGFFYGALPEVVLQWAETYYAAIARMDFVPNSPTLMNAGRELQQLSACFVLPVDDSMESIFEAVKNTALIHKSGGGTGFSFSRLRPKHDVVKSTKGISSGPISFMTVFDAATETIKQGGTRRGANMGILRVDHPDVLDFISCKAKSDRLNNFNISVALTEEFMKAVEADAEYPLINPHSNTETARLKAREVFEKIVDSAWRNGEPGIIFIDRINRDNPTPRLGAIESTNPCITGETLVAVADGRGSVPIRQLAEEGKDIPVFCRNGKGKVTVRMMRNARLTGRGKRILKVALDDGNSLRTTENHKFVLSDGSVKEAKDLLPGDSLGIMTRRVAPFEKVFSLTGRNVQPYSWISSTDRPNWDLEHRLIANFYFRRQTGKNISRRDHVVHHRDYNGLNNDPANLLVMTKEEHYQHHAKDREGDKNPMRRFPEKNWRNDPARQKEMREKHHVGAKRGEVTKARVGAATVSRFADEGFRALHSEAVKSAMTQNRAEFMEAIHARAVRKLEECRTATDLPCFLEDNVVMVERSCEHCGATFVVTWNRREQSFCSQSCYVSRHNGDSGIRERIADGLRSNRLNKAEDRYREQIRCLLDLKFESDRMPLKKEWEARCAVEGVPKRLGTEFAFPTYDALKTAALMHNHRVVAVVPDGVEDVYNGTVDEFHNFYVGHFQGYFKGDLCHYYINTCQCGEQPLLPYESCNLGSINLANMISGENGGTRIDYDKLKVTIHDAVRFLDNVIDMNNYPLNEIRQMTMGNRKIGLGVMGFADMLIRLGIPYDSDEALAVGQEIMSFLQEESVAASTFLARERGAFPNYGISVYPERQSIPRRNATTTTIAPTGTISIIAGCSSGIEPVFALSYIRNVMDNDHMVEGHPLFEAEMRRRGLYSVEKMKEISQTGSVRHMEGIPDDVRRVFATAHDISPEAHLRMQAAFQKFVDNAVSKTVNFPSDATREDIRKVFVLAYRLGCKGVTVYRDRSRDEQVLNIGEVNRKESAGGHEPLPAQPGFTSPRPRPDTLLGVTKEMKTSCGKLYVTINRDPQGIFEIFNQMGKAGGCAASQSEAIGRLVSLALRSGVQPDQIIKQLKGISCHLPTWGGNGGKGKILSCADAVSKAIEWYMENVDKMFAGIPGPAADASVAPQQLPARSDNLEIARGACPDCGSQVEMQEGCLKCRSCGFSEC
ncbi:MAG: TSCPD domain-containing protein [Deltaproteobacteria bacterium]|nr:TSCPD domain-containing protein [Deltaproteobacteria bacterium]